MKEGPERPSTAQEKLLLHNVYKAGVSFVENTSINREKREVLEAIVGISDERLKDFQDGNKLIRIKYHTMNGMPTEWEAEAVAWCDNTFTIIRDICPSSRMSKSFTCYLGP